MRARAPQVQLGQGFHQPRVAIRSTMRGMRGGDHRVDLFDQLARQPRGPGDPAEVGQVHRLGRGVEQARDRCLQRLGLELYRRGGRDHECAVLGVELAVRQPEGVAGEPAAAACVPYAQVVARMAGRGEFVVRPLPNLLFTRDSSVWVEDRVAVTSPSMAARQREATLTRAIYTHLPRFAGAQILYGESTEEAWFEGGDVLVMAPGVVAVGTGQRTTPAGVEAFALRVFAEGIAHTVLAVPIAQERATMHLDTICTMVDRDAVVMFPAVADTLSACTVTPDGEGGLRVSAPTPFLEAAAAAM
ncbi:MAG: hypothetical protein KY442_04960, partial [Proteobacteria bacterium]|nr:hypothetical protein [Pseudomonadota bacterium]